MGIHRHLVNTIEQSIVGGDVVCRCHCCINQLVLLLLSSVFWSVLGQLSKRAAVWCVCLSVCQQYVGGQPVMQLQLAQQQAAGAQELYANGYADAAAAAAASSSAKQMVPPRQSSSEYRYVVTGRCTNGQ